MITEERLKELIKDNKPIYIASSDNGINVPRVDKYGALDLATIMLSPYSKQLYEKKSDWEFDRDFRNITRTETLTLMDYDTFKLLDIPTEFSNSEGECYRFEIEERIDKKYVCIFELNGICSYRFNKPLTKENYIEACRLAKKLFLGEEV